MPGAGEPSLVLGASGFLGSHVVRHLVEHGLPVRAMVRPSSSVRALAGLDVELVHGDVRDPGSVQAAMQGCGDVYHCVVDPRPWQRDPTSMWQTNVGVLPGVMEAALASRVRRFVFTSSLATMAIDQRRTVDESRPNNWCRLGGAYVTSRVQAENLVLRWARERSLPAVAMCVATTYGRGDHLPTPHGAMLLAATLGRLPFYVRGAATEVVAVDEAARALVLAADRGRVGERYIVSERTMAMHEILSIGAEVGGVRPPRVGVPTSLMHAAGFLGEQVARVRDRDVPLTRTSVRLMHVMTPLDHGKAGRELGWHPRPTPDAVRDGAEFFLEQRAARAAARAAAGTAAHG